eukprot:TRINITY_DN2673_c0_g1_i1.p1 TRINITY_DN2673_c0_g1~~TRINITY_DN2673_c0_g1_i1.p1  ORF type:complete len:401 (+),score=78.09 TRINITY_DN2673_c0_g1_i1:1099-2301(+)
MKISMTFHLYRLGRVSWQDSQLAYHALAHLGREGLILCSPQRPYVSVGYFQDPVHELDLEYCQAAGLPVFRREVGGGAVYLDREQVFWQLVLRRDHPLVSVNRQAFYRRFLEPVAAAYRDLGVEATIQPINDLVVGERKIAGTGAGEIGECVVFVGNIMRSFDCAAMARTLATPSPDFRRLFRRSMEDNLTSLRRELGPAREAAVGNEQIHDLLALHFAKVLGPLSPAGRDPAWDHAMQDLRRRMLSPQWINFARRPQAVRQVKVRAGLFLHHWRGSVTRQPLEAQFISQDGRVMELSLRGGAEGTRGLEERLSREFVGQEVRKLQKYLGTLAAMGKEVAQAQRAGYVIDFKQCQACLTAQATQPIQGTDPEFKIYDIHTVKFIQDTGCLASRETTKNLA